MTVNGPLVWGLVLIVSFLIGVSLATYRRDGHFRLRTVLTDPQPTPPSYVLRELRREGFRALARGDILLLLLSYAVLASLVGFAIGMVLVKRIGQ